MKTVSRPEWTLMSHSNFEKKLVGGIREVFAECHMKAQVIWDRNGPCVVFENSADADEFSKRF